MEISSLGLYRPLVLFFLSFSLLDCQVAISLSLNDLQQAFISKELDLSQVENELCYSRGHNFNFALSGVFNSSRIMTKMLYCS
jgi:hypothetical protein